MMTWKALDSIHFWRPGCQRGAWSNAFVTFIAALFLFASLPLHMTFETRKCGGSGAILVVSDVPRDDAAKHAKSAEHCASATSQCQVVAIAPEQPLLTARMPGQHFPADVGLRAFLVINALDPPPRAA